MTVTTLADVKAKDIMRTKVITLVTTAPVREAIETFEEYHISGAPVLDEAHRLVGVLSAFDIAKSEHMRDGRIDTERAEYYLANPLDEEFDETGEEPEWYGRDDYDDRLIGRETVGDWMTPKVISVKPEASLKEVCDKMRREGIHRLLVIDDGKLAGLLSTFDVVKFLAEKL